MKEVELLSCDMLIAKMLISIWDRRFLKRRWEEITSVFFFSFAFGFI